LWYHITHPEYARIDAERILLTENNESNENTPTAFKPAELKHAPRSCCTPVSQPLPRENENLRLPLAPCSSSLSFYALLAIVPATSLSFISLFLHSAFRLCTLDEGSRGEFSTLYLCTVIIDVLTESNKRHKWSPWSH